MQGFVGIDPGAKGAIALLAHGCPGSGPELLAVASLPTTIDRIGGRKSPRLNGLALGSMLAEWQIQHGVVVSSATIERVHAMPKDKGPQAFAFGRSYGAVQAVLETMGVQTRTLPVSIWRQAVGIILPDAERSRDQIKTACRRRAQELWPDQADWFKRVKDTDAAEAALIGLAGME